MPGPLGPLPSMSSTTNRSAARRSAAFNDVDEAALDDLLGSDTEDVDARLSRTRARAGKATRLPAAGLPAAKKQSEEEKTARDDWDNDSEDDRAAARPSKPRPALNRQRPLPARESAAASSSSALSLTVSGAEDMDAQLFGLSASSSSAGSQLSRSQPVAEEDLLHLRQRSRSLIDDRDERQQADEKESRRAAIRRAMEQPTPADTPQQPRKPRLTVDKLQDNWEEPKESAAADEEHQAEEGGEAARGQDRRGSLLGDSATDRRARYREMMKKKREERQGSITAELAPSSAEPAAAAAPARARGDAAASSSSQPSSSPSSSLRPIRLCSL